MRGMDDAPPRDGQESLAPAPFDLRGFLFWLPACLVNSVALAWLSVLAERHFAPWLLFSLACGAIIGLGAIVAMRIAGLGHRGSIRAGSLLAVAVFVGGQHHFHYRVAQQLETARQAENRALQTKAQGAFPQLAERLGPDPPRSLAEYIKRQAAAGRPLVGDWVARGPWAWASWGLDAALVAIGTWGVMTPALRRPFCRRCQSWYRTTRAGKLAAHEVPVLAALIGATVPEPSGPGFYRLLACRSGCGPWRLEMVWHGERAAPVAVRPGKVSGWLEPQRREEVSRLLDQVHQSRPVT